MGLRVLAMCMQSTEREFWVQFVMLAGEMWTLVWCAGIQILGNEHLRFVIIWNFRQLGFRTGQAVGGSYFGQTVPNKYAMEDVGCTGMEDYLRVSFNKLFLVLILLFRIANIRPITPAVSTMEQEYSVIHNSYSKDRHTQEFKKNICSCGQLSESW